MLLGNRWLAQKCLWHNSHCPWLALNAGLLQGCKVQDHFMLFWLKLIDFDIRKEALLDEGIYDKT
jgi:hypothetical protein